MADIKTSPEEREKLITSSLEEGEDNPTLTSDDPFEDADKPAEESPKEETPSEEKKETTPDITERYKASTQEAQILHAQRKKFNDTVEKAAALAEPTEEELQKEYSDWDVMTETEKRLAKDNLINKRRFDMVHQATQEGREIEQWSDKVDEFLTGAITTYPRLAGKENQFKSFTMKETRRGLDFEDLVKAFLYDATEAPKRTKSGSLLETGSGASGQKPKPETIDAKQAAILRTSNHKLYQKMIREGKIKIEV